MKKETKDDSSPTVTFTLQTLEKLKQQGFRYLRVNAFTKDRRPDYIEPHYFVLVPFKDMTDDAGSKGIYEPIDSQLLTVWANFPDDGIKVFVTMS